MKKIEIDISEEFENGCISLTFISGIRNFNEVKIATGAYNLGKIDKICIDENGKLKER